MKKTIVYALAFTIILSFALVLAGCGSKELKLEDVEKAVLTVGGSKQEEHTKVNFLERENIKELFQVEEKLADYNPHNVIMTWKLDIQIEYYLKDGSKVNKVYKGIRPVSDYLENIYNSLEYKEQTIPLFKLNKGDITKIKLDSYMNNNTFETTDKNIINQAYDNMIKHFRETLNFGGEESYTIGYVDFFNAKDERIAGGTILRGEKQWESLLNDHPQIKLLKYRPEDIKEIQLEKDNKVIRVNNPALIDKILNTYKGSTTSYSEVSVEIVPLDYTARHLFGSYEKGRVPEYIKNLF